ncbi:juxtaposed with another zinc finger protein 1-like [Haliotis asinina]|uniref:juxtaposed with another zinc finger protein 1-like n=1 Tax=Haliotis asinina TaxID=109174 RepID=UPI003531B827
MAVFLVNNCAFPGCGLTFTSLADLIQHIEDIHIDTDPRALEKQELQQPSALALSYVLRFFTEAAKKENADPFRKRVRPQSPAMSLPSSTPTGSEIDEEEVRSDDEEDSNDSWTTQEEFSSDTILSMMGSKDQEGDKPFACPVPGCKKRYKNINGIKYHARHGHKREAKIVVKKSYKCFCGKSYKTVQGLRNHSTQQHQTVDMGSSQTATIAQSLSLKTQYTPTSVLKTIANNTTIDALLLSTSTQSAVKLPQNVLQSAVSTAQTVRSPLTTVAMTIVQAANENTPTLSSVTPMQLVSQSSPALSVAIATPSATAKIE